MQGFQSELLGWAAAQPALTGVVILAAGVLYGFFGFRMFRFLLAVTCSGLGWLIGTVVALVAGQPPELIGPAAAIVAGLFSLKWERPAVIAAAAATWGAFGHYLATQVHFPQTGVLVTGGVAALLGGLFGWLCYRTMRVILTTMQGAVLMVMGFVSVSAHLLPAVGVTFRQWAGAQSLVIPVFLSMLCAAAYSYQAMHHQGDICTGK